jgi:hypothetical protein
MEKLSAVGGRYAGTEGERAMLHAVRERLPTGVVGRIEGFVGHAAPSLVHAMHDLALVLCGVLGFFRPEVALLLGGLVTLSLILEGAGRTSLFRWVLPKRASYNLVVRMGSDAPLGAIVFSTPLDVPRWRPADWPWLRSTRPMRVSFGAAMVVIGMLALRTLAEPWGPRTLEIYVGALIVLSVGVTLSMIAHRRHGSGQDDATGSSVLLELMRRLRDRPLERVDVWLAFTGCGRAYQGGMEHFLSLHRASLREPVLVVALDAPGRPLLRAAVSEGTLFAQHHRATGPALVERLGWAGVHVHPIDHPGTTDARPALHAGLRALALVGGEGNASPEATARAVDVVEALARWYAGDVAQVAGDRPALAELARSVTPPPQDDLEPEPRATASKP